MDSNKRDIDIDLLVFRYMSNQATSQEVALLDAISNEDSDAAYAARRARRLWDLTETPPTSSFDYQSGYQQFLSSRSEGSTVGMELDQLLNSSIPSQSFNADSAFAKFQKQIRAEHTNNEPTLKPIKEAKVRTLSVRRLASIAAVMLCVFSAIFLMQNNATISSDASVASVSLKDGSNVVLSPGTEINVLSDRSVELRGNAFFDVHHDPSAPFTISVDDSRITVLGTSFTVVDNGDYVEVSLREGSVMLEDADESVTIVPGEKVMILNERMIKSKVDSKNAYSLADGYLVFDKTPIEDVVVDLMNHYNLRLTSDLVGCTLTATRLEAEDAMSALDKVAKVLGAKVVAKGSGYHLEGSPCK